MYLFNSFKFCKKMIQTKNFKQVLLLNFYNYNLRDIFEPRSYNGNCISSNKMCGQLSL